METKDSAGCLKEYNGIYRLRINEYRAELTSFFARWNIHTGLAIAGIVGPMMLTLGDLTAGLATPDYSLVKNSISSLALTNIGWLQTIGFMTLGLLVEVFAAGLMLNVKRRRWFNLGIAILVLFGFAMLLIGAFHTDALGAPRTFEGRLHGFVATTAFSMFPFAVLCLWSSVKRDPNWKDFYRYCQITFVVALLMLALTRIFQEGTSWFGLGERLLVANMIIWVEVMAVRLFVLSIRRGEEKQSTPAAAENA